MRDELVRIVVEGQEYLRRAQRRNGSWCDSPWETAFCVISLYDSGLATATTGRALQRATDWLASQVRQEKQGASWESFTWDTALALRACHRVPAPSLPPVTFDEAIGWMCWQEQQDLEPEQQLFHFGYSYPAQTLLALVELNREPELRLKLTAHLKSVQEEDGGWITDFDTSQIVEALARQGESASNTWTVNNYDRSYEGGLARAAEWIERVQTPSGGWSGLTLPASLMLRAYLLAAETPDRDVVGIALSWFRGLICDDGSCFHEPARTGAMIDTMSRLVRHRGAGKGSLLLDLPIDKFVAQIGQRATERAERHRRPSLVESRVLIERLEERDKLVAGLSSSLEAERNLFEARAAAYHARIRQLFIAAAAAVLLALAIVLILIYLHNDSMSGMIVGTISIIPILGAAATAIYRRVIPVVDDAEE